jgi:hypothetical protein
LEVEAFAQIDKGLRDEAVLESFNSELSEPGCVLLCGGIHEAEWAYDAYRDRPREVMR